MRLAAAARRSEVVRSRQPFAVYRQGGLCIGPELAAAVCSAMPKGGRVFVLAEAARPKEAQWDCDSAKDPQNVFGPSFRLRVGGR
mgnify:CR=1 FL=1